MEEESISLLTSCKFTLCDKIPSYDNKLNTILTKTLQFKIAEFKPLVIEKDCPSPDDIKRLFDALKASLHSHNRKDSASVEHHSALFVSKQREGNVTSDNLMQKSSLQAVDRNRQFTNHTVEDNGDDNCSNEISPQVQDINDDIHDLVNNFQGLNVKDNDPGHGKHQIENNFSRNSIFKEQTNVPLESENIAPLENDKITEKQEENSHDRGEGKNQAERTQQENLRKEEIVGACGCANKQIIQNNDMAPENEMKFCNHKHKQDSQYMEHTSKNTGQLTTDSQNLEHINKNTGQLTTVSQNLEHTSKNTGELTTVSQNLVLTSKNTGQLTTVSQNLEPTIKNTGKLTTVSQNLEHISKNTGQLTTVSQNLEHTSKNTGKLTTDSQNLEHTSKNTGQLTTDSQNLEHTSKNTGQLTTVSQNLEHTSKNTGKLTTDSQNLEHTSKNTGKLTTDSQNLEQTSKNTGKLTTVSQNLEHTSKNTGELTTVSQNLEHTSKNTGKLTTVSQNLEHTSKNTGKLTTVSQYLEQTSKNTGKLTTVSQYLEQTSKNTGKLTTVSQYLEQTSKNTGKLTTDSQNLEHTSKNTGQLTTVSQNLEQTSKNTGQLTTVSQYLEQTSKNTGKLTTDSQNLEHTSKNTGKLTTVSQYLEQTSKNTGKLTTVSQYLEQTSKNTGKLTTVSQNLEQTSKNTGKLTTDSQNLEHTSKNTGKLTTDSQNLEQTSKNTGKLTTDSQNLEHTSKNTGQLTTVSQNLEHTRKNTGQLTTVSQNLEPISKNTGQLTTVSQNLEHTSKNTGQLTTVSQNLEPTCKNTGQLTTDSQNLEHTSKNTGQLTTVSQNLEPTSKKTGQLTTVSQNLEHTRKNTGQLTTVSQNLEHTSKNTGQLTTVSQNLEPTSKNTGQLTTDSQNLEHTCKNTGKLTTDSQNLEPTSKNTEQLTTVSQNLEHTSKNTGKLTTDRQNLEHTRKNTGQLTTDSQNLEHISKNTGQLTIVSQNLEHTSKNTGKLTTVSQYLEQTSKNTGKLTTDSQNLEPTSKNSGKLTTDSQNLEHTSKNTGKLTTVSQNLEPTSKNTGKLTTESQNLEHTSKNTEQLTTVSQNLEHTSKNTGKLTTVSQCLEHTSKNTGQLSTNIQEVKVIQTKLIPDEKNNSSQATNMSREANKQSNEEDKNKNCESISSDKSCIKTTDHVNCNDAAGSRTKMINMAQILTTSRQEIPSKQNNVPTSSSSSEVCKMEDAFKFEESGKQATIDKLVHSQEENTENENYEILRMDINRTDMNHAGNVTARQHIVQSDDAKLNKDVNLLIHKEDKNENHILISNDMACITADTTVRSFQCKMSAVDDKLNDASHTAAKNREVDKEILKEDKTEEPTISQEVLCMQRMETRGGYVHLPSSVQFIHLPSSVQFIGQSPLNDKQILKEDKNEDTAEMSDNIILKKERIDAREDQVHHPLSAQNVCHSPINDIVNQEHSSNHKNFASSNMPDSILNDNECKSNIFERSELEPSHFSPINYKRQDSTDSSNSDAESEHYTAYSVKASSLDSLKKYFKESCYNKYFDDAKNEGTGITFRMNLSDEMDASFLNKLKHLKVEECEIGHKDKKHVHSAAEKILAQTSEVIIDVKDSKVHIVGLKDFVIKAKKKLFSLLQNQDPKANQLGTVKNDEITAKGAESLEKNKPDTGKNQSISRDEISNDEETWSWKSEHNEVHHKEPQSSKVAHNLHSYSSLPPVETSYSRESECNIFSKDHNKYYVTNESNSFRVEICNADITKLEVDCIVNAANKRLQHGGGVAKAISLAAGLALNKECEAFINSGNQVAVTDIFLSTGGNLPAKCVIHAVGPKWEMYDDNNKARCLEDLRHTVIRCFVEAGRQGFTSIALPSISAAIFKVPKEACAKCYMEAVKHFGTFSKEKTSLCEIKFVDVDNSMVKVIQDHFDKNWTNPCDPHIVQRDCEFANTHLYSETRNTAKHFGKSPATNKITSSSASTKIPGASRSFLPGDKPPTGSTVASPDKRREGSCAYLIGKFTLHTDTRPAFNHSSDITITIGKPFDKLSGLRDFSVSKNKKKIKELKNTFKVFNVVKPKSQQQKLLCALLPEPDDADTIKEAIQNLDIIKQSPNHQIFAQKIRKVVLTSSILYEEPNNVQNKKTQHSCDRKKVGDFARCLFEFLNRASEMSSISITLVGCEDALLSIHKVMESRQVQKISPEVQQGARSKTSDGSQYRNKGSFSEQNSAYAAKGSDYTRQHHDEDHHRSSSMAMEGTKHCTQGAYSRQHSRYPVQGIEYPEEDAGSSVDLDKTTCQICACEKHCFPLKCCGNYICQGCQQKVTICPYCRAFWRVFIGDQPPGTMSVDVMHISLAGYEPFPTWKITYIFPSGHQKDYHPNPGEHYTGISRTAYLPATDQGFQVLKLLWLAFLRKLTFTIGRSLTMGRENSIVWNDIHHKTNPYGGMYGYPDPNYLHTVYGELASKGVTFDTVSPDEIRRLTDFEYRISAFGHFADTVLE